MKAKSKTNKEAKDQIPMGENTKGIPNFPQRLLITSHSRSVYSRGMSFWWCKMVWSLVMHRSATAVDH